MIALQITATTPHGVVLSRPWGIALDGLLASVLWHRRKWAARAAGQHLTYRHQAPPEVIELPLARCGDVEHDPDWHWMATFADLHPHSHIDAGVDVRWRTSRTNHQRLQQLAGSIGSQAVANRAGRYQHRIVPVMAHPVSHLTWQAVGDAEQIRDLLADLPSIGKHRGVGEGLVSSWEVSAAPASVDHWAAGHEHEPGVLGRPCSPRCLEGRDGIAAGPFGSTAMRPPYLHPASRAAAYQPAR